MLLFFCIFTAHGCGVALQGCKMTAHRCGGHYTAANRPRMEKHYYFVHFKSLYFLTRKVFTNAFGLGSADMEKLGLLLNTIYSKLGKCFAE